MLVQTNMRTDLECRKFVFAFGGTAGRVSCREALNVRSEKK